MTEIQYRNRSISSLVQQLNNLGSTQVLIQNACLIAIQTEECKQYRRFQTKSAPHKYFFKSVKSGDKKYFYNQITTELSRENLLKSIESYSNNYNSTILFENDLTSFAKVIELLNNQIERSLLFCAIINSQNQVFDLFGQCDLTHRQLIQNKKYYQISNTQILKYLQNYYSGRNANSFVILTYKNPQTFVELNICMFPSQFFEPQCFAPYSLMKTQLIQILNYIKINPNKRYEHISHLITKRHPMTNLLTKILMSDTCNVILNWVNETSSGKFQFYDKLNVLGNLLRKPEKHMVEIGISKGISNKKQINPQGDKIQDNLLSMTRQINSDRSKSAKNEPNPIQKITSPNYFNQVQDKKKQVQLDQKQFNFCRSLQRKTHKYSISPRKQTLKTSHPSDTNLDKKTISKFNKQDNLDQATFDIKFKDLHGTTQTQQIVLLKAQHAREISQYHQTIQTLNQKLLILVKQKGLQELYKLHEKEIMLLELKVQQLRTDIIEITKTDNEEGSKKIVKKMTEQLQGYQSMGLAKKASQGRAAMLQKQLNEFKDKLIKSDKARAVLAMQVDSLTKRLKIRDIEIAEGYEKLEHEGIQQQVMVEVVGMVRALMQGQRNAGDYLIRKVEMIVDDLDKAREAVLECNQFLVQLMEMISEKLNKQPEIVLDCNKFIRTFLMDNLNIF